MPREGVPDPPNRRWGAFKLKQKFFKKILHPQQDLSGNSTISGKTYQNVEILDFPLVNPPVNFDRKIEVEGTRKTKIEVPDCNQA